MLCLKCEKKETLQYSELCEDCENKSLGIVLWLALISLSLTGIFTLLKLVEGMKLIIFSFQINQLHVLLFGSYFFISGCIVVALVAYTLYLFFKTRSKTTSFVIITLSLCGIFACCDFSVFYFILDGKVSGRFIFALARDLVVCAIWISYFFMSDKVKLHFVN